MPTKKANPFAVAACLVAGLIALLLGFAAALYLLLSVPTWVATTIIILSIFIIIAGWVWLIQNW